MTSDPEQIRNIPNDYSHYKPLNPEKHEIRLLVLWPRGSSNAAELKCCLIRTSLLTESPFYEAISHCWGDLRDTKQINLEQIEATPPRSNGIWNFQLVQFLISYTDANQSIARYAFNITAELYDALRHLRRDHQPRVLWIDLICTYPDRSRTKCCRNLRCEPLFCADSDRGDPSPETTPRASLKSADATLLPGVRKARGTVWPSWPLAPKDD